MRKTVRSCLRAAASGIAPRRPLDRVAGTSDRRTAPRRSRGRTRRTTTVEGFVFRIQGVDQGGRRLRALHRSIRCRDARQRRAQGPRHDGDRRRRRRAGHDRHRPTGSASCATPPRTCSRRPCSGSTRRRSSASARPITDGFYYDFGVERAVHPRRPQGDRQGDGSASSAQGQRFVRRVVTDDEARAELADEPYKLELIGLKGRTGKRGSARTSESVEVGAGELTIYDNVEPRRRDGLEGPLPRPAPAEHPHDRQRLGADSRRRPRTGAGARRTRSCSASTAPRGPRRTSCAPTSSASRRPPSATTASSARELDLFSFPEEIGSGLSVWHPRGGIVRSEMEQHAPPPPHRRRATPTSTRRTSRRRTSSCSRTTSSPTRRACSRPSTWTRSATSTARSPSTASTTT